MKKLKYKKMKKVKLVKLLLKKDMEIEQLNHNINKIKVDDIAEQILL